MALCKTKNAAIAFTDLALLLPRGTCRKFPCIGSNLEACQQFNIAWGAVQVRLLGAFHLILWRKACP